MKQYTLLHGDCLERLKELPDNSVDSIVTDPPYGLSFMGKKWDYDVPSEGVWRECLRVLKPGGFLLAFAGTRTQHRIAVRIEDAGFEIRDMIAWIYGSGFPKSLDVSKAIDKAAGADREVIGQKITGNARTQEGWSGGQITVDETAPSTPEAQQWEGWGTALKPALEPITVARKPLGEKTVAENVLKHGTGGINVDGCRVSGEYKWRASDSKIGGDIFKQGSYGEKPSPLGRFPANIIHDNSEEVRECFPETSCSGTAKLGKKSDWTSSKSIFNGDGIKSNIMPNDSGNASRFFYCAKASKRDRDEGLDGMESRVVNDGRKKEIDNAFQRGSTERLNTHPTVKPTSLMQYLCRLVTPSNGTVLDPFMGSGSTGKAAMYEGFDFIGIEREQEYMDIARARIEFAANDNESDETVDNQLTLF